MILAMIPPYYQPSKEGVQIICVSLCEFSSICSRSGEKFQTFQPRGAATGVGLVGILFIGNSDGVRTSSKSMCARGVLSRPHGKDWSSLAQVLMTAPSKPEHLTWRIMVFQKETCQFKLPWPVTSSLGLIKISTVRNHHYTTGLIFWRISGIISYI